MRPNKGERDCLWNAKRLGKKIFVSTFNQKI
jgi:hypothetical protein